MGVKKQQKKTTPPKKPKRTKTTTKESMSPPKPFSVVRGSPRQQQLSRDSTVPLWGDYQRFYAGLRREQKMSTYYYMVHNVPICDAIVQTLVNLSCTPMYVDSGDSRLDSEAQQILDRLGLDQINQQIDRNLLTYGHSASEFVLSDDLRDIEKIVCLESLEVRYAVNQSGDVQTVLQYPRRGLLPQVAGVPGTRSANGPADQTLMAFGAIEIPPEKTLVMVHRPANSFDHYGKSVFQTALPSIEALNEMYKIRLDVYRRFGSPRYVINVPTESFATQQDYEHALQVVSDEFNAIQNSTDNLALPPCDIRIVGAEGATLKFSQEFNDLLASCITPSNVPAALLGYPSNVTTESYVRQILLMLSAMIRNLQRLKAAEYERKLAPILSAVYGFPVDSLAFRFEPARLTDQLLEQQTRELQQRLDWAALVNGEIGTDQYMNRSWGPNSEPADLDVLTERIEQARTKPQPEPEPTDKTPRKDDLTKQTDVAQSNDTEA